MGKLAVSFILLIGLVQVPDVLSRSAKQAAVPAPNVATREKSLPGLQAVLKGLFLCTVTV